MERRKILLRCRNDRKYRDIGFVDDLLRSRADEEIGNVLLLLGHDEKKIAFYFVGVIDNDLAERLFALDAFDNFCGATYAVFFNVSFYLRKLAGETVHNELVSSEQHRNNADI